MRRSRLIGIFFCSILAFAGGLFFFSCAITRYDLEKYEQVKVPEVRGTRFRIWATNSKGGGTRIVPFLPILYRYRESGPFYVSLRVENVGEPIHKFRILSANVFGDEGNVLDLRFYQGEDEFTKSHTAWHTIRYTSPEITSLPYTAVGHGDAANRKFEAVDLKSLGETVHITLNIEIEYGDGFVTREIASDLRHSRVKAWRLRKVNR